MIRNSASMKGIQFALSAVMVIGAGIISDSAVAQTRPAYAKNVDEPGRLPYEYYVEFGKFGCSINCSNFVLFGSIMLFDAPAVPAGKCLILNWISASVPSNDTYASVSLQSTPVVAAQSLKWSSGGPFTTLAPGGDLVSMSSAAFATFGPGEVPHIRVFANTLSAYDGSVTLAGYLIDATN